VAVRRDSLRRGSKQARAIDSHQECPPWHHHWLSHEEGFVFIIGIDPAQGVTHRTGSIQQLDIYAIPEAQDPAYAAGFGDLSIHEVALDPEKPLAYFSYDAGGFRVATYNHDRVEEVGAFIDEGGNNFWAVEIWHDENGEKFVLASDRDFGLCIFQYPGRTS
jgi:hypothetical protein